MISDTIEEMLDEVQYFEDNERRLRKQTRITIGAAIVFSLTLLAVKYDVHKNFVQLHTGIEDNRRSIENVEENQFTIVPACYDSIAPNTYEVRPCSGTEIRR